MLVRQLEELYATSHPAYLSAEATNKHALIGVELESQGNVLKQALERVDKKTWVSMTYVEEIEFLDDIIDAAQSTLSASTMLIQANFAKTTSAIQALAKWIMSFLSDGTGILLEIVTYVGRYITYGLTQMLNAAGRLIAKAIHIVFTALRDAIFKALEYGTSLVYAALGYLSHLGWKGQADLRNHCNHYIYLTMAMQSDRAVILNEYGLEAALEYEQLARSQCSESIQTLGMSALKAKRVEIKMIPDAAPYEWLFDQCVAFLSFIWKRIASCMSVFMEGLRYLMLCAANAIDPIMKLARDDDTKEPDILKRVKQYEEPKPDLKAESQLAQRLLTHLMTLSKLPEAPPNVVGMCRKSHRMLSNVLQLMETQYDTVPFLTARQMLQRQVDSARILVEVEKATRSGLNDVSSIQQMYNSYCKTYQEETTSYLPTLFMQTMQEAKKTFILAFNQILMLDKNAFQTVDGSAEDANEMLSMNLISLQKHVENRRVPLQSLIVFRELVEAKMDSLLQSIKRWLENEQIPTSENMEAWTKAIISNSQSAIANAKKTLGVDTVRQLTQLSTEHGTVSASFTNSYTQNVSFLYELSYRYMVVQEEIENRSNLGRSTLRALAFIAIGATSGYLLWKYIVWAQTTEPPGAFERILTKSLGNLPTVIPQLVSEAGTWVWSKFKHESGVGTYITTDLRFSTLMYNLNTLNNPLDGLLFQGNALSYFAAVGSLATASLLAVVRLYNLFYFFSHVCVNILSWFTPRFDTYERHRTSYMTATKAVAFKLVESGVEIAAAFAGLYIRRANMIAGTLSMGMTAGSIAASWSVLGPLGVLKLVGSSSVSAIGERTKQMADTVQKLRDLTRNDNFLNRYFELIPGLYNPYGEMSHDAFQMSMKLYTRNLAPIIARRTEKMASVKQYEGPAGRKAIEYHTSSAYDAPLPEQSAHGHRLVKLVKK